MKTEEIDSQSAMQQIAFALRELSSAKDIKTVAHIVCHAARSLTSADGTAFVLREENLSTYTDEDAISSLWKGRRFPMSNCVSGWAMLNKQAAIIEDVYADSRIQADMYKPTFVQSLAMIPIGTTEPIGALGSYWAKKNHATLYEIEILQSLADIACMFIEKIKLQADLENISKYYKHELEFANKDLESFSYSVSHDLRAPIRAIIGYIKMLEEDYSPILNDDAKELIEKAVANAEKMNQLIDALLQLSRTGRKELEKTTVEMKQMAEGVYQSLIENEKQRQIDFTIEDLPNIQADETLIKQVWINYISNALKYTRHKPTTKIHIGFQELENQIIYFIKDNGAGFDMKYSDKLFNVFQRLHSLEEFEGTGIGLSIVKKIIKKHGGSVWAEAAPNEGATFYFTHNNK